MRVLKKTVYIPLAVALLSGITASGAWANEELEKLADDAGRALQGPERAELERADKAARKGPRIAPSKKL